MDSDSEWSTSGPITDTDTDNEDRFISRHHDYVDLSLNPKSGFGDGELPKVATLPSKLEKHDQSGQYSAKAFSLGRMTQVVQGMLTHVTVN